MFLVTWLYRLLYGKEAAEELDRPQRQRPAAKKRRRRR